MNIERLLTCVGIFAALDMCTASPLIIPGDSSQDLAPIVDYVAPYIKFSPSGLFVQDTRLRLQYSLSDDGTLKSNIHGTNRDSSTIELLVNLSDNHWIALNKRELPLAKCIAKKMEEIILGRAGLYETAVSDELAEKLNEFVFRCVEQISLSVGPRECSQFLKTLTFSQDELSQRNALKYMAMLQLATNVTNTPLFFQSVSLDFLLNHDVGPEASVMFPQLEKASRTVESLVSRCIETYQNERSSIIALIARAKAKYSTFLAHLFNVMKATDMADYRSVDQGQTSDGHVNTCMFNSVFLRDVEIGLIGTAKIGSIERASRYMQELEESWAEFGVDVGEETLGPLKSTMCTLQQNRSADAQYAFVIEIRDNQIFPGILASCSALEVQCRAGLMNLAILPKQKLRDYGNTLFSYFGTGCIMSENLPLVAVSCSTGHAQTLQMRV
ncbi:MAG: hypothetical protein LBB34_03635 [Holosporales bacterium]|jgi:hypothetical protein|nr:hypothetical protein [Holosporales bacterium]